MAAVVTDDKMLGLFRALADEIRAGDGNEALAAAIREAERDPSKRVGAYVLLDRLGEGGGGTVHRAWHPGLRRVCAVKLLPGGSEEGRRRLAREAQIAAQLAHPGIVTIHEVGEHQGRPYVVMELVDGPPLDKAGLAPRQALEAIRAAAEALQHAHERGILHRDLKPANILLAPGGPKLVDFGLARLLEGGSTITQPGSIAGTPAFMAPETARSEPGTARTDIYGLGATLYALLAGRPPHEGQGVVELLSKAAAADPPPLRRIVPSLHRDLEVVVAKAMAREPDRRYASARDMADDLGRYLGGRAILARPASVAYRLRRAASRHPIAIAAVLAILAAGVVGGAVAVRRVREEARAEERRREIEAHLDLGARRLGVAEGLQYGEGGSLARVAEEAERAVAPFEKALALDPRHARANAFLGRTLALLGRGDEAVRCFTAALDAEPRLASARLGRGRILLARYHDARLFPKSARAFGDVDGLKMRALDDLRQVAESGAGRWDFLHARALVALAEGRADDVVRLCPQTPPDDVEAADVYVVVARARLERMEAAEAERACGEALRLRPGHAKALEVRGQARQELQRWRESVEDYAKALRYDPSRAGTWNMLGISLYQASEFDKAVEAFDAAIRLRPDMVEPHSNRALVRAAQGRFEEAASDLDVAISKGPEWIELWLNRSAVRQRLRQLDRALQDAEEMVARWPGNPVAWTTRGLVRAQTGDTAGAEEDAAKALSLKDRFAEALVLRALVCEQSGRHDEAIEEATRAIESNPKEARAWATRGSALIRLGRRSEGLADLREAMRLDPALRKAYEPLFK